MDEQRRTYFFVVVVSSQNAFVSSRDFMEPSDYSTGKQRNNTTENVGNLHHVDKRT